MFETALEEGEVIYRREVSCTGKAAYEIPESRFALCDCGRFRFEGSGGAVAVTGAVKMVFFVSAR